MKRWVLFLCIPFIALSGFLGYSLYLSNFTKFPLRIVSGDAAYLQGIEIHTELQASNKNIHLYCKDGVVSYTLDHIYSQAEEEDHAVMGIGFESVAYEREAALSAAEKAVLIGEEEAVEQEYFHIPAFTLYAVGDNDIPFYDTANQRLSLRVKSNDRFSIILEKSYPMVDDGEKLVPEKNADMASETYYVLPKDAAAWEDLELLTYGDFFTIEDDILLIKNTRADETPRLMTFTLEEADGKYRYIAKELVTLDASRQYLDVKKGKDMFYVLSRDDAHTYISCYDSEGKLQRDMSVDATLEKAVSMGTCYVNEPYIIWSYAREQYVLDTETQKVSVYRHVDPVGYVRDMYVKDDRLYVISSSNVADIAVYIQVYAAEQEVLRATWEMASIKEDCANGCVLYWLQPVHTEVKR